MAITQYVETTLALTFDGDSIEEFFAAGEDFWTWKHKVGFKPITFTTKNVKFYEQLFASMKPDSSGSTVVNNLNTDGHPAGYSSDISDKKSRNKKSKS